MMKIALNQKGVGILEVLVVVAIIGIVSVMTLPKYSEYKKAKNIGLAKTQIINEIRISQNYTLSTIKFVDGTFPEGGYGIRFETSKNNFIIFADKNNNRAYDIGEFFESVDLPTDITIGDLFVNGYQLNVVDFVSVPPYGDIYINNKHDEYGSFVDLSINYTNGTIVESVLVRSSGFIN